MSGLFLSIRPLFALGAIASAGLLGFGYFLQYVQGQEPCPLCLVQRGFYYGLLIVFAIGAVHGPRRWGVTAYGVLALLFAGGGLATAGRQVWLHRVRLAHRMRADEGDLGGVRPGRHEV